MIELRYRLPHLWAGVLAGQVTPWRARAIAQATVALTPAAAGFVDEQTAWCANRLTPSQLIRLVDHARARFMPEALAKEIADAADRRHVTFTTDQVSYDGTMHLEADLEIPDALGLAEAVPPAPPASPPSAPKTRWTGAGPPRSATWPATSSRSASTTTRRGVRLLETPAGDPAGDPDRAARPPVRRRDPPPRPRGTRASA